MLVEIKKNGFGGRTSLPCTICANFCYYSEGLDLSAYALKRLLNHKMNNDVTAGYIMKDVERLRKPMQQVTNFILEHMMETAEL